MKFNAESIIAGSSSHTYFSPNKYIRDDFASDPEGLGRDLRYQACVVSSPVLASTRLSSSTMDESASKSKRDRNRKYLDSSDVDQLHTLIDALHIDDNVEKHSEKSKNTVQPKTTQQKATIVAKTAEKKRVVTRSNIRESHTTSKTNDESNMPCMVASSHNIHSEAAFLGLQEAKVYDAKKKSLVTVKRSARLNK